MPGAPLAARAICSMFTILKQAGYTGTISLKITDPNDIKGSIANIKRILAEVEAEG